MIGILAEDNDLHLVEWCAVESIEYLAAGRIAGVLLPFGNKELLQFGKIWRFELRLQDIKPCGVNFR